VADVGEIPHRTTWFRRGILLLIGVPLAAVVASATASLVPDRLILDSLVEGVERSAIIDVPQVGVSGRGVDVFSDCIALTIGLGDSDGGLATNWLRSPTLGSCEGAIESIERYGDGQGLSGGYEYFRYWHGYTAVSRPLVAAVGVSGARIVLFWAFIGVLAVFARRLWRFHGPIAPVALLGPFLLTSDTVELARSLPHGLPALVAIAGAWGVHRAAAGPEPDRPGVPWNGSDDLRLATVAFVSGAMYVYVDLLTTPPGAWALVTCVALLASARRLEGTRLAGRGALVAAAWITGWVWTWVSKWVIAAAVLGIDRVRDSVGDAVDERLAGEREYLDLSLFSSIELNVETWLRHPLTPAVLVAVAIGTLLTRRSAGHWQVWRTRLIVAAPALLPLLWFEVLRNHSLVHVLFVHRSLGVSAGIVALALLVGPSSLRVRESDPPDDPILSDAGARAHR
jgi:hypothetical protein